MMFRLTSLAREAGFRGLFAGLGPRCIMTAGLVAGQFILYDQIKHGAPIFLLFCLETSPHRITAMGAPPGIEIHKE